MAQRVASLLPSATEIVCAVNAQDLLVGRSHECDHPSTIADLPVLTRVRKALPRSSGAIDRTIRQILTDAITVYELDVDALEAAAPELIVTQDLCDVCAVSIDDVRAALRAFSDGGMEVLSLRPTTLQDVWDDVRRVGAALGRPEAGEAAAERLEARCAEVARRAAQASGKPRVLTIEWIDPVMIGGTWMPELVTLAGGSPLVTSPGDHAPTLSSGELKQLDPDVVLIKPCGFDLARTTEDLTLLSTKLPWQEWRAVAEGRVFVADGNAFFNRPGPRLVESLEILASCVHPEVFEDLCSRHAASYRRITSDLRLESAAP